MSLIADAEAALLAARQANCRCEAGARGRGRAQFPATMPSSPIFGMGRSLLWRSMDEGTVLHTLTLGKGAERSVF
jgi:hypothetical protein